MKTENENEGKKNENDEYDEGKAEETEEEVPEREKDYKGLTEKGEKERGKDDFPTSATTAFDLLLRKAGDYGRFQWRMVFITGFQTIFTAFHNIGAVFLAATPDHWCKIPHFLQNDSLAQQAKDYMNFTTPWIRGKKGDLELSKCQYYDYNYSSLYFPINISTSSDQFIIDDVVGMDTKDCSAWFYDDIIFESTVVTEWDLVCKDRWLMSTTQASYMMGILMGAVVFSAVSDKIGRRKSLLLCCLIFFISSIAVVFMTSFSAFLVLRFIVAASGQGLTLISYVLLMECVSAKGRNVLGNLSGLFFALGFILLVLMSYFIRNWRLLQLALSIPGVTLVICIWILPESPRWFFMQGYEDEGFEMLVRIAKTNKREFPSKNELKPILKIIADEVQKKPHLTLVEKMKSVLDMIVTLFRTPNMRRRNVIMSYAWFVCSMLYYGLAFGGANFTSNIHLSVALIAIVQPFENAIIILFLLRYGRRTGLVLFNILSGIACISVIFVPKDIVWLNLILTTIGKMAISVVFALVFLYSSEMVPTHVRNMSIGIGSMFARIGSGIAPYIVDLLGDIYYAIPSTVFGALAILAGLLALLLPETGNKPMPESIREIESMPR